MPTISLAIQKGGSGKTTTAISLAAALQHLGEKVLLVDLDPQANCSQSLGFVEGKNQEQSNIYQLLQKEATGEEGNLQNAIWTSSSGIDIIPATLDLANAELELVSVYGRESLLKQILEPLTKQYDYIFIDCPPSIGMLTVNALVASDFVVMPLNAEFLHLNGVRSFLRAFQRIQKQLNSKMDILGFVLTKYDPRKNMNQKVLQQLTDEFGEKVFKTHIRNNIALATAQEKGIDIFSFDKSSNGAKDYMQLAQEFLKKF